MSDGAHVLSVALAQYGGRQRAHGDAFVDVSESSDLAVLATFSGWAGAFVSEADNWSRIDHIALPTRLLPAVSSCRVIYRAARRLQMIPSRHHRDHLPVRVWVDLELGRARPAPRRPGWDHDALVEAVRNGARRDEFLGKVRDALDEDEAALAEIVAGPKVGDRWQALDRVVLRAAEEFFFSERQGRRGGGGDQVARGTIAASTRCGDERWIAPRGNGRRSMFDSTASPAT